MSLIGNSWKRTLKRAVGNYETFALEYLENNPGQKVNFVKVCARILEEELEYTGQIADNISREEYKRFQSFDVYDDIAECLRRRNPQIPDKAIQEIFDAVKCGFERAEHEHQAFLYFMVSYILEERSLEPGRGGYLLEIMQGNIPKENRIKKFFRAWHNFAKYEIIKDQR